MIRAEAIRSRFVASPATFNVAESRGVSGATNEEDGRGNEGEFVGVQVSRGITAGAGADAVEVSVLRGLRVGLERHGLAIGELALGVTWDEEDRRVLALGVSLNVGRVLVAVARVLEGVSSSLGLAENVSHFVTEGLVVLEVVGLAGDPLRVIELRTGVLGAESLGGAGDNNQAAVEASVIIAERRVEVCEEEHRVAEGARLRHE